MARTQSEAITYSKEVLDAFSVMPPKKDPRATKMKRKKLLIGGIIVVLLICIGIGGNLYWERTKSAENSWRNELYGAKILGASIQYVSKDGVPVHNNGFVTVSEIRYDTTEVLLNTHGFLEVSKSNLTPNQLQRIFLNGNGGLGWKPLDPATVNGLNESKQSEVYKDADRYLNEATGDPNARKTAYIKKLTNFYTGPSTSALGKTNQQVLQDKYGSQYGTLGSDIEKLPYEVTKELLSMYETAK